MKLSAAQRKSLVEVLVSSLPAQVRSRILLDESFSTKFGLDPTFLFPLSSDLAVQTDTLHRALRRAAAGERTAQLILQDGKRVRAKLGLTARGEATLLVQGEGFSFTDADILSPSVAKRSRALDRMFAARPLLPEEEVKWRSIAIQRDLTDREFLDLSTALTHTPENLRRELKKPGTLDVDTVMPDDPAYYSRLMAPLGSSKTLAEFAASELFAAYSSLLNSHAGL
jgi:hypothetical protein